MSVGKDNGAGAVCQPSRKAAALKNGPYVADLPGQRTGLPPGWQVGVCSPLGVASAWPGALALF